MLLMMNMIKQQFHTITGPVGTVMDPYIDIRT